jgi:hypothetical protein
LLDPIANLKVVCEGVKADAVGSKANQSKKTAADFILPLVLFYAMSARVIQIICMLASAELPVEDRLLGMGVNA